MPKEFSDIDKLRREYLLSISNENRRKQSYFVWRVLEKALASEKYYNPIFCFDNGKWMVKGDECYFSLAHSSNVVCCAISKNPIGVDVELINDKLLRLKNRYSIEENSGDELLSIAECWTREEARFKASVDNEIKSCVIETSCGERYFLSVCTNEELEIINTKKLY